MQIHYFQRYHSKENVDTSNTMLMLSRLYNYNADKFFAMLNALILEQDETPEITFDLQVVGDESVPDAIISQKSFKIVVETKLHNQFQQSQLEKHLTQFGTEEIKVLLTLDPKPMKESFGKDGEKGFDGAITNLMMQTYLCNCDFKKRVNKRGIEYGWDVAVYSSIEHIYGYDYVTSCYKDNPQDSWKQLVDYMRKMYPEARVKQIRKILK